MAAYIGRYPVGCILTKTAGYRNYKWLLIKNAASDGAAFFYSCGGFNTPTLASGLLSAQIFVCALYVTFVFLKGV